MHLLRRRRSALRAAGALILLAAAPHAALAIEAGDPNPPTDTFGQPLYPADSYSSTYDPTTHTGRQDNGGLSSPFSGVGQITGGTGSLIDATHVLTAAHIFTSGDLSNPSALSFNLPTADGGTLSEPVSAITIFPGWTGSVAPDDYGDVAVVTLANSFTVTYPTQPAPATYTFATTPLPLGSVVTLVGRGESGYGTIGYVGNTAGPRRVGENTADTYLALGGASYTSTYAAGESYIFDFDAPTGYTASSVPNYTGGPSLGNTVETTIGDGDSGSPAFVSVGSHYQIVALNNFATTFGPQPVGQFGSGGGGPVIASYQSFILSAVPEPSPFAPLVVGTAGVIALVARRRLRRAR